MWLIIWSPVVYFLYTWATLFFEGNKNYITYLTKKNGYLGVEGDTKIDFNPSEITTKLSEAYFNANDAVGRMKGSQKKEFLGQTMAQDNNLRPYTEVAQ